nr:hypothetical protein Iba_chr09eCG10480 [Ipomoea batatas]
MEKSGLDPAAFCFPPDLSLLDLETTVEKRASISSGELNWRKKKKIYTSQTIGKPVPTSTYFPRPLTRAFAREHNNTLVVEVPLQEVQEHLVEEEGLGAELQVEVEK